MASYDSMTQLTHPSKTQEVSCSQLRMDSKLRRSVYRKGKLFILNSARKIMVFIYWVEQREISNYFVN